MGDSFRTIRNILRTQYVQDYLETVFQSVFRLAERPLQENHQPVYILQVSDQFKLYEALLAVCVWMGRPQNANIDGIILKFRGTKFILISRGRVDYNDNTRPIIDSQPGQLLVYDYYADGLVLTAYQKNYSDVFSTGQETRTICEALTGILRGNLNDVFGRNPTSPITRAQLVLLIQVLVAENFERLGLEASTRTMGSSFLLTQFLQFGIGNGIDFERFRTLCLFVVSSNLMHPLRSGTEIRRVVTDEAQEFLLSLEVLAQSEEAQSEENFGRDLLRAMYCIVENNIAMP